MEPLPVPGLRDVKRIFVGDSVAYALREDGGLWAWGTEGTIGIADAGDRSVPQLLASLQGVRSVASRYGNTCAVLDDQSVWCWGENEFGQLGDGTTQRQEVPVRMIGATATAVAVGLHHVCIIRPDQRIACLGSNFEGELGTGGGAIAAPTPIGSSLTFASVTADEHTCAIATSGELLCWGRNDVGQLGLGAFGPNQPLPQLVPGVRPLHVVAGSYDTCFIALDHSAWCMGTNSSREFGHTGPDSAVPVAVQGIPLASAVSSNIFGGALDDSGRAWIWGGVPSLTAPTQVPVTCP